MPDELFVSNISAARRRRRPRPQPAALIARRSTARRRATSSGSAPALFEVRQTAGAMHQAEQAAPSGHGDPFRVRCRARCTCGSTPPTASSTCSARRIRVLAEVPRSRRPALFGYSGAGRLSGAYWARRDGSFEVTSDRASTSDAGHDRLWIPLGARSARVARRRRTRSRAPVCGFVGGARGSGSAFFVAVYRARSRPNCERHPAHRPIETEAPDARFAARHWSA